MLKQDMTKSEIEKDLQGKGDFVQIDHLIRFLKDQLSMDTKKFVFLKLAVLYEKAKLIDEAAKMYNNAAELAITFTEKINYYKKEAELYIKSGAFDRVEKAMRDAMSQANLREKEDIYNSIKQFYKIQAAECEKIEKRNQAVRLYEKLLEMRISESERGEIKAKLLELYRKTGKIKEYSAMEKK
jgi:tetratricopeptide (TPR) repeat protein